jgi:hypothetical protein
MPRFLVDQPLPLDTTDRLEDFLRRAAASPLHDDPVVQAAIGRVQGYLRERHTPIGQSEHEPVAARQ